MPEDGELRIGFHSIHTACMLAGRTQITLETILLCLVENALMPSHQSQPLR